MKNSRIIVPIVLVAISIASMELSSCKKGEEDPFLSLRSRKSRLTGEWTIQSYSNISSINGEQTNSDAERYEFDESRTVNWDGSNYNMTTTRSESGSEIDYAYSGEYDESLNGGIYTEEETYSETYDFDNYVESYSFDGDYTASFLGTYTFNDDGTFSAQLNVEISIDADAFDDGTLYSKSTTSIENQTISGTWSFIDGNDADDFKNGERIALWYTSMDISNEETYQLSADGYTMNDEVAYTEVYTGNSTDADEIWELIMLTDKEIKATRTYAYDFQGSEKYRYVSTWFSENSSYDYSGNESGTTEMNLTQN